MRELPEGWGRSTLEQIAAWGSGGTPSRKYPDYFGGDIPWIKTGELGPKYIKAAEECLTQDGLNNSSAKLYPAGSVGIAMYGATIGKVSIFGIEAATNQAVAVARPADGITFSDFLFYYLLSIKRDLVSAGKGGAQPNISQELLCGWPIALPPLPEQQRIVAKVEELFSGLDAAEQSLTTARLQLGLYRQALLKAAFEGRLTARWRAANKDKLESPAALLQRIRTERQARHLAATEEWKTAVKAWEQAGKPCRKPRKSKKPGDTRGNAVIPDDLASFDSEIWPWLLLGDISEIAGGLTKSPKRNAYPRKMKYLRVANVYADRLELDEITEIGVSDEEWESNRLAAGDLLVVEGNGSIEQIGRVAMWNGSVAQIGHQNHLIRVRLINGMLPRFFLLFLLSPVGRRLITRQASSTSGLHTLSLSKVSALPVPVPCLEEQSQLVDEIEPKLSQIDATETEITTNLQKIATLRQAILKRAFSGRLVPQDPADEPAATLLAHLRASAPAKGKARQKSTRKASA